MATTLAAGTQPNPLLRISRWLVDRLRPELGWIAYLACLLLLLLPGTGIREAGWVNVRRTNVTLDWIGPISLTAAWWLLVRWRAFLGRAGSGLWWLRGPVGIGLVLGWLLLAVLTVTQTMVHWIPGPVVLFHALRSGEWTPLWAGVLADWGSLVERFAGWWQGVQGGGALQDDLVFLTLSGSVIWMLGGLTGWLALRRRRGLEVALPVLWVVGTIQFYGSQGRALLILGLALTMLLHIWLDQRANEERWRARNIDYNPALLLDRGIAAGFITLFVLVLAGVTPALSIDRLAFVAYERLSPVYKPVEDLGERLFPDLERPGGNRFGRIGSGLPNRFLLTGGPDLARIPVMQVSTNQYTDRYDETPPRLYMRKATFSIYDGRGWQNPRDLPRRTLNAGAPWTDSLREGRTELVQRVQMAVPTSILFAAGEPIAPQVDYRADMRGPDDLVALWSQQGNIVRYNVVSAAPAVGEDVLRTWPGWPDPDAIPEALQAHLQLPDTVTERTRALAGELTAGRTTLFEKASAIEAYLRTLPYDLDVPGPPANADVADFFLFDLGRGYCDYYTTAFVVMARLNGMPTRFATGYISVYWDFEEQAWTITEAEAHSWPEVYFPDLGWIPFEPTAGRPALERVSAPAFTPAQESPPLAGPQEEAAPEERPRWNWQMLVWLLPLAGLVWLIGHFILRRRRPGDPWLGLVNWGRRAGRPHLPSETELEYGAALARHVEAREGEPERRRRLVRTVLALAQAVSAAHYAAADLRAQAAMQAQENWQALRREVGRRF